jgi:molybdopterin converting factor subunit 1
MITVLLFARLREELGTERVELPAPADGWSLAELISALAGRYGAVWQEKLTAPHVIVSRNQEVFTDSERFRAGDEVAFYPPVTGG